jgi:transposase
VAEAVHTNRGPIYPAVTADAREGRQQYLKAWAAVSAKISLAAEEAIRGWKPDAAKLRRGRPGYPDEHYREIAELYSTLILAGERAPNEKIAKIKDYSPSTVAGWVKKARELGYLPPGKKGKAG